MSASKTPNAPTAEDNYAHIPKWEEEGFRHLHAGEGNSLAVKVPDKK